MLSISDTLLKKNFITLKNKKFLFLRLKIILLEILDFNSGTSG